MTGHWRVSRVRSLFEHVPKPTMCVRVWYSVGRLCTRRRHSQFKGMGVGEMLLPRSVREASSPVIGVSGYTDRIGNDGRFRSGNALAAVATPQCFSHLRTYKVDEVDGVRCVLFSMRRNWSSKACFFNWLAPYVFILF